MAWQSNLAMTERKNRKGRSLEQGQKENVKEEDKNMKQENKRYSKDEGENVMNQSNALKTDRQQIQKVRKRYLCKYCGVGCMPAVTKNGED